MKKWIALSVKFAISVTFIWFLFRDVDFDRILAQVLETNKPLLLAATALLLFQVVVVSWRWKVILHALDTPLSFQQVVVFSYISTFFNQVLPASVGGDAVRIYKAYKAGLRIWQAFNSIFLDRVATLLAIAVLMGISLPWMFDRIGNASAQVGVVLMIASVLAATAFLLVLDRLPASLHKWKVIRGVLALVSDARRVLLTLRHAPTVLSVSIFGLINLIFSIWFIMLSLSNDVSLLDCLLLVPPILLISSLPISIAGWGVREGAMVTGFGFVGVAPDASLVVSILFGVISILVNLPGGVVWLVSRDPIQSAETAPS